MVASGAWQYEFFQGLLSPPAASVHFLNVIAPGDAGVAATFERYPGLCYVAATLVWEAAAWAGIPGAFPIPLFILKGRKVRNYTSGLDVWSDNPAWCLADYIVSTQYGRGATVNTQSVIDAATYCDETFVNTATGLSAKKHTLNYFLLRGASHKAHIDAMRAHFRCNVIERGGEMIFVIDKDKSPVMTFNEAEAVPISIERMGGSGVPNQVVVKFPDPLNNYEPVPEYARTAAVDAGTAITKEADYELEGVSDGVHAASEAFYLLNSRLNNLRVVLRAVHPKAMQLEPGDVIEYTTATFGLASFLLRVLRVTRAADGTAWTIETCGHDPAVYTFQSRAIETYPIPALPDPFAVPSAPTAPSGASTLTIGDGLTVYPNKVGVTWDHPGWPYALMYAVTAQTAIEAESTIAEVESGPVFVNVETLPVTIRVYAFRAISGVVSAACAGTVDPVTMYGTAEWPQNITLMPEADGRVMLAIVKAPRRTRALYGTSYWTQSGITSFDGTKINDGNLVVAAGVISNGDTLTIDFGLGNAKTIREVRATFSSFTGAALDNPNPIVSLKTSADAVTFGSDVIIDGTQYIGFAKVGDVPFSIHVPIPEVGVDLGPHRAWRFKFATTALQTAYTLSEFQIYEFASDESDFMLGYNIYDMATGTARFHKFVAQDHDFTVSPIDVTAFTRNEMTWSNFRVAVRVCGVSLSKLQSNNLDAYYGFGYGGASTSSQLASTAGAETLQNKTLDVPVVADFTNAQHNHQSAAGGGLLSGDGISPTTGTGAVVRAASPQFTLNVGIGTPAQSKIGEIIAGVLAAVSDAAGLQVSPTFGAGAQATAYGISTAMNSAPGVYTIAHVMGNRVHDGSVGAGATWTQFTSLYIDAPTAGSSINRAILVAGGTSEFGGPVLVPTAAVDTNTTQAASTAFVLAQAASANPLMNGTAAPGTSTRNARGDHVHPTDTSRAPIASPAFTGTTMSITSTASVRYTLTGATASGDSDIRFINSAATVPYDWLIQALQGGTLRIYDNAGGSVGERFTIDQAGLVGINQAIPLKRLDVTGDIAVNTAGNGLYVKEGTNATMGVAVLVTGVKVVSTTKVTANSRIFLTVQVLGTVAAPKAIAVTARTAGTSFTITSSDATDTSSIGWLIIEPY
jgi:hypothetical protein